MNQFKNDLKIFKTVDSNVLLNILIEFCDSCDTSKFMCSSICENKTIEIVKLLFLIPKNVYLRKDMSDTLLYSIYGLRSKIENLRKSKMSRIVDNILLKNLNDVISISLDTLKYIEKTFDYAEVIKEDKKLKLRYNEKTDFLLGDKFGMYEIEYIDEKGFPEINKTPTVAKYNTKPFDLTKIAELIKVIYLFRKDNKTKLKNILTFVSFFKKIELSNIFVCRDTKGNMIDCFLR